MSFLWPMLRRRSSIMKKSMKEMDIIPFGAVCSNVVAFDQSAGQKDIIAFGAVGSNDVVLNRSAGQKDIIAFGAIGSNVVAFDQSTGKKDIIAFGAGCPNDVAFGRSAWQKTSRRFLSTVKPPVVSSPPKMDKKNDKRGLYIPPGPLSVIQYFQELYHNFSLFNFALIFKRGATAGNILSSFRILRYDHFDNLRAWLMRKPKPPRLNQIFDDGIHLPKSIDWKARGALNPVKHQGQRLTGWAVILSYAIESYIFIETGVLYELSVEQLVQYGNKSNWRFRNGMIVNGVRDERQYVEVVIPLVARYGLTTSEAYPYGRENNQNFIPVATIKGFTLIDAFNEAAMKAAVLRRPIIVYVHVDEDFRKYEGGIYKFNNFATPSMMDHNLLVYGYDETEGVSFWKCLNSWGSNWGEGGEIRIEMWKNSFGLSCRAMMII